MKTAIVLDSESPSFLRQAGEINTLISSIGPFPSHVELWLYYTQKMLETIPEMVCPICAIRCFQMDQTDLPEYTPDMIERWMGQHPMELLIFPGDGRGEELATRTAFRCGGSSGLLVESMHLMPKGLEIQKPAYGNSLSARLLLKNSPYCLAAAQTAGPAAGIIHYEMAKGHSMVCDPADYHWLINRKEIPGEADTGLLNADLVVVAGQGAKNKETINFIQQVADTMGAELGASRQAVMNAWVPMNRLLGVSGKAISPKICIVAGVSGSAVFTAGIKGSECIIAINTDKDAPIFNVAHVGIVGDLKKVLSALLTLIQEQQQGNGNKE